MSLRLLPRVKPEDKKGAALEITEPKPDAYTVLMYVHPKDLPSLKAVLGDVNTRMYDSSGTVIITTTYNEGGARQELLNIYASPGWIDNNEVQPKRFEDWEWPTNAAAVCIGRRVIVNEGTEKVEKRTVGRAKGVPQWSHKWSQAVYDAARAHGLPPAFALGIYCAEGSQGDPKIRSRNAAGQYVGAVGLMQVMPSTGQSLGFSISDLEDPYKNINAGMMVLKQHSFPAAKEVTNLSPSYNRFLEAAAAAYNMGPGNLKKFRMDKQRWPQETSIYVPRVMNYMKLWKGAM